MTVFQEDFKTSFLSAFLSLPVVLACLAPVAQAGDTAEAQILGFSKDGAYFAFEQYGIEDGSGFPYSELFVLDVARDAWVKPAPFYLRNENMDEIEGENGATDWDALLSAVRAENRANAQELLRTTKIAGKGKTVGHNPRTEITADPHRMAVHPRNFHPLVEDPVELSLSEYELPSKRCAGYSIEGTKGFRLTMTYKGKTRILNEDTGIPESRRCPLGYRIERIVTHFPENGAPVFAVLVQMDAHGFEGPDQRYLAITGRL
ncbi:DUF2259 domain-containing protein [Roseibium aggregatum]|uniref:DUF2259 domain-containing protein n=1 Tax=Roseibium aggregatum TaxID=187304 RepID=A0A939EDL9_9HYPH|nr:DUF2259 domain-containing protein [Roseibium aggregatum]MBN9671267.1 DUF2259 domain-containing protein [Roseibium aggregatum]